jgi:hypothetical protein
MVRLKRLLQDLEAELLEARKQASYRRHPRRSYWQRQARWLASEVAKVHDRIPKAMRT